MPRRARKPFRRRGTRDRWLEAILAVRPELEQELTELRQRHAQGYRKRLVSLAWELNLAPPQAPREYPHEPSPSTRPLPTEPLPEPVATAPEAFDPPMAAPEAAEAAPKRGKKKKAE